VVISDGSLIPVYLHHSSFHLKKQNAFEFNVLGHTVVFNQFQVCFNDQACRVTFQKL
jgi:hypothetical protein